jgi:hypothetical protein
MKKYFILFVMILFNVSLSVEAQDWTLKQGNVWSRQAGAIKRSIEKPDDSNGKETIRIEHTGNEDWAFSECNKIPVKPGEVFEFVADLKSEGTIPEKNGNVSISVVLRKKQQRGCSMDLWR